MKPTTHLTTLVLLAALAAPAGFPSAARAFDRRGSQATPLMPDDRPGGQLFTAFLPDPEKTSKPSSIAVVREQAVEIDASVLAPGAPPRVHIALLDGDTLEAVRERVESRGPGDYTWRGRLAGSEPPAGTVTITVKDGAVSGLIFAPDAVYQIIPRAGGEHRLAEIDQSRFPGCGDVRAPAAPSGREADAGPGQPGTATEADSRDEIDVMIVFTPDARAAAGGLNQIRAEAQAAVDAANAAYENSGITTRLVLVHTQEIARDETGDLDAELDFVSADPTVADLRDEHAADLVSMLVEDGGNLCGLAFVMRNVGPGFESAGFSVVDRECASGNLSFAHELGHNQGCEHNPENSGATADTASFPWSFGHFVNGSFRTVMSTSNQCTSGCIRMPNFSNPNVSINGQPSGIADQRDNRRTINDTAVTVANFRDRPESSIAFTSATLSVTEGTPQATITIARTGSLDGNASVAFAASANTAAAPNDFTPTSGTASFAPNQASATFNVPIANDNLVEGDESLILTLSNPVGATLGRTNSAALTIRDNDSHGTLQFSARSFLVGEAAGSVTVTVTRTGGSATQLQVPFSVAPNTAAGADFTAVSGTLLFTLGVTNRTFTVPIANDAVAEGNESFLVRLGTPRLGVLPGGVAVPEALGTPSMAVVTIVDNDGPANGIQIAVPQQTVGEGAPASVTVTRPNGLIPFESVTLTASNGTATAGTDFVAVSVPVNFVFGATSVTVPVPTLGDATVEGDETINLTLTAPAGTQLGARRRAVLTIADDDSAGVLQFAVAASAASEAFFNEVGPIPGALQITVTRTGGSAGTVSVTCATSNNTAIAGGDFTAQNVVLTFGPGDTSETFTVPFVNDAIAEGSESFNLTLSNPTGGARLGSSRRAVGIIEDDDQ